MTVSISFNGGEPPKGYSCSNNGASQDDINRIFENAYDQRVAKLNGQKEEVEDRWDKTKKQKGIVYDYLQKVEEELRETEAELHN